VNGMRPPNKPYFTHRVILFHETTLDSKIVAIRSGWGLFPNMEDVRKQIKTLEELRFYNTPPPSVSCTYCYLLFPHDEKQEMLLEYLMTKKLPDYSLIKGMWGYNGHQFFKI